MRLFLTLLFMTTFLNAETMNYFGYTDCLVLQNTAQTRVILAPQAGGRILEYALNGTNVLYQDPTQEGWTSTSGKPAPDPCGGRFDVGPEFILPRHPALWLNAWEVIATSARSATIRSVIDPATGLQLTRTFVLDDATSRLRCIQTMRNCSSNTVSCCYWSRTLATGHGIVLIPLSAWSRFPKHYIMYGPGSVMNFMPDDPAIRQRDGFLEIIAPPERPKLGMDAQTGAFAYLTRDNLLFVKHFAVHPDRPYAELAGLTISIWYKETSRCELEPIGPLERLAPGAEATYEEQWALHPFPFPHNNAPVDLTHIRKLLDK